MDNPALRRHAEPEIQIPGPFLRDGDLGAAWQEACLMPRRQRRTLGGEH